MESHLITMPVTEAGTVTATHRLAMYCPMYSPTSVGSWRIVRPVGLRQVRALRSQWFHRRIPKLDRRWVEESRTWLPPAACSSRNSLATGPIRPLSIPVAQAYRYDLFRDRETHGEFVAWSEGPEMGDRINTLAVGKALTDPNPGLQLTIIQRALISPSPITHSLRGYPYGPSKPS